MFVELFAGSSNLSAVDILLDELIVRARTNQIEPVRLLRPLELSHEQRQFRDVRRIAIAMAVGLALFVLLVIAVAAKVIADIVSLVCSLFAC